MKKIFTSSLFRGISYGIILIVSLILMVILDPPSSYSVTEQYTFISKGKKQVVLAVIIPKTQAYQEISNLKIEGADKVVFWDTAGLQVARIESLVDEHKTVLITFHVFLPKGSITWDGAAEFRDIIPQPGIESNHPELLAKSRSIATKPTTRDARKIYDFVSTWLKWPSGNRIGDSSSALLAYRKKVGVCGDFSMLMTAMLRGRGIPARSIVGLSMPQYFNFRPASEWNHQAQSHAWVEFYTDGKWHFADPSWGGNNHFNNCDGFHLSYGEIQTEQLVYANCNRWLSSVLNSGTVADTSFSVIGAMSAPLKFMAASKSNQVTLKPQGTVKINYGYRFPVLIVLILLMGVFELLVRRKLIFH